jgi:hypothetical protein
MEEIWKPVVGYEEFYKVSHYGNVRRILPMVKLSHENTKTIREARAKGEHVKKLAHIFQVTPGAIQHVLRTPDSRQRDMSGILKLRLDSKGYPFVSLSKNGKVVQFRVHTLVVTSFIGPMFPKGQVNHLNGIRHDNRLENLEMTDNRGNSLHRYRVLGKLHPCRGSKHPKAKLSESDIPVIRTRLAHKEGMNAIARSFLVTPRTIAQIKQGITWTHVP